MRISGVFKPSDYPGPLKDVAELFDAVFPGVKDPQFDLNHSGLAFLARSPKVAANLARLSRSIILDTTWCSDAKLRELAIQSLNLYFKSLFSYQARLPYAKSAGLGDDQLGALDEWRTTALFNDQERLVIGYTLAVASGEVPSALFAAIVEAFGEQGAVELTSLIAVWSAWAMIINAAGPAFPSPPE